MSTMPTIKELFKAGAHYGHRRDRTDARSNTYVFGYFNRVSVINLEKTVDTLEKALNFLADQAKEGATVLFVGTKTQAQGKIKEVAEALKMPYIIKRWPGGLLTNYEAVGKAIRKMVKTGQDLTEGKFEHLKKKERLMIERGLEKSKQIFGGMATLEAKPDVIFVIDAENEKIALKEALRDEIPVVSISDTASNLKEIDYPIVANDDSLKTIEMIMDLVKDTIQKNYKPKVKEDKNMEERLGTGPKEVTENERHEKPQEKVKEETESTKEQTAIKDKK